MIFMQVKEEITSMQNSVGLRAASQLKFWRVYYFYANKGRDNKHTKFNGTLKNPSLSLSLSLSHPE